MTENLKLVKMGYIKASFGIKGWIKLSAHTQNVDSLLGFKTWYLAKDSDNWKPFELSEGKVTPDGLIVKLVGVDDKETAHALKGFTIAIPRDEFEETEQDEYYWTDLIGMSVHNQESLCFGEVVDLMQTGAHDVLVVKGELGQKLIPFVKKFILDVDAEARMILVDWGADY